jgi:hypothetical protein
LSSAPMPTSDRVLDEGIAVKMPEWLGGLLRLLWYVFAFILWPMGFILFIFPSVKESLTLEGNLWLVLAGLAIAYAPLGIGFVYNKRADAKAQRTREEQRQAEEKAESVRHRESERLRGERKAQAHREKVERFHRDRLDLEPIVVGDPQAGIRSPYEVEMTDREKALLDAISSRFDPSCVLVDTFLDRGDGTTAQIDIIAICRQGIIVIESKGYGGRISGKMDDRYWKHEQSQERFYSPIWQNRSHVESLYRVLDRVLESAETREDPDDIPF